MKYLIGNWKSNYSPKQAKDWIDEVKPKLKKLEGLTTVLCPGYIHLPLFHSELPQHILGAQYISPFPNGAYTGQVSSKMLGDLVDFSIAGHSERRTYFKESNQDVLNQVDQAISEGITPVVAVDKDNWHAQLSIISPEKVSKSIVMYEPPEAISKQVSTVGKGQAAPIDEVVEKIREIKKDFSPKAVIYGGSITSENIVDYISKEEIDGVLPGSSSLHSEEWLKMIGLIESTL